MTDENQDECKYGHDVIIENEPPGKMAEAVEKVRNKQITNLTEWKNETDSYNLWNLFGGPNNIWKKMKISSGSQGNAWGTILGAVDKFEEDLGYDSVTRTEEKMFIPAQSQLHSNFMQQRQQAEQRVKESMQSMSHLIKKKHLIEHDLRKMRTRVENLESEDEVILKSDFIELVDSAGGGQQAAPGSLDFLRNNNLYPSIVAEFQEMDSLDDLKKAENHEDMEEDGKLADIPNNMKAILKKKYTMYEKWKDMYGSELQKKVRELNAELRRVEKQIDETEEWLQPYIRDIIMINEKDESDWGDDFGKHYIWQGYSSIQRNLEFICAKKLAKTERGELREARDGESPTHYRIAYINAVHVNLADPSTPEQIQNGPSTAVIMWSPAIVCKHVYENIIQQKENLKKTKFKELMDNYTAMEIDLKEEVQEMKEKRREKVGSVRDLRNKIEEKINEDRSEDDQIDVPIELSSMIRRVEDGVDEPRAIMKHGSFEHGEQYLEAIDEILGTELHPDKKEVEKPSEFKRKIREFTGTIDDEYYVNGDNLGDALGDLTNELQFSYYIDFKKSNGYYTMK